MRVLFRALVAIVLAAAVGVQSGCNKESTSAPEDHPAGAKGHEEGGSHAEGEHPEEGPHKGHLIELGKEEYHAELTHDEATSEVAIYLLDGAAKEAVPVAETELTVNVVAGGKPSQYTLQATPQPTDPQGQSSRFATTDKNLHESLEMEGMKGELNITINGKPYTGQLEHHDHEEAKH